MSWFTERGYDADVVLSSRIRMARNVEDFPFSFRMAPEHGEALITMVEDVVSGAFHGARDNFSFVHISELPALERQVLVEKHIISPELAEGRKPGGVVLSRDERISVMVNEEDHVRIQCLMPGLDLQKGYETCEQMDNLLSERLRFAWRDTWGYLTACPTNMGTGLRASAMLHLPALAMTGQIAGILEAVGKIGMTVRGLYGENSQAEGNLFQISNQITLGMPEGEIIASVTQVTGQIIDHERQLRQELLRQNRLQLEDRIFRSYGLFANARLMSNEEAMRLLSDVRLGADMGILRGVRPEELNEILVCIQPASLQHRYGKVLMPEERDARRADYIRSKMI